MVGKELLIYGIDRETALGVERERATSRNSWHLLYWSGRRSCGAPNRFRIGSTH
jgi:hypothetical protein